MSRIVDVRGLSCPQPIIAAKKAMAAGDFPVEVLTDSAASRENVSRMAQNSGMRVRSEQKEGDFLVIIEKK